MNAHNTGAVPTPDAATSLPPSVSAGNPFRSLRHRNYRRYFFGQLVSLTGTWAQTTALMWVAFQLTGESIGSALVAAAEVAPTLVLGNWGGSLADRWPKRTLLLITQPALILVAFILAALVYFGNPIPFWLLLLVTAASGAVQAVDFPARLSFIIDMVGRDDLMNAVALNSLLFNIARALGPAIGGWLLVEFGPAVCFVVNGLSYAGLILALLGMDVGRTPRGVGAMGTQSMWEGFRYLIRHPELGMLVALAGLLTLCGWPFLALLPAFTEHYLGLGVQGYSALLSATGVGALMAALTAAAFGSLRRHKSFIVAGTVLVSGSLIGLSFTNGIALAITCCSAIGFGLILFLVTSQGIVQIGAHDAVRGRVMAVWAIVIRTGSPLGNLIAGPAARFWGEPSVLRVQGTACGLAVVGILMFAVRSQTTAVRSALPEASRDGSPT